MEKDAKRESELSFPGGSEKVVSVRGILTKSQVRGCISMNEWIQLETLQVREGWTKLSLGLLISSVYMKQPEANMRKGLNREQVNLGLCQGNIRDLKIQSVGKFFPALYMNIVLTILILSSGKDIVSWTHFHLSAAKNSDKTTIISRTLILEGCCVLMYFIKMCIGYSQCSYNTYIFTNP